MSGQSQSHPVVRVVICDADSGQGAHGALVRWLLVKRSVLGACVQQVGILDEAPLLTVKWCWPLAGCH